MRAFLILALLITCHFAAGASEVALTSIRDTCIYSGSEMNNSSGGGASFMAGTNRGNDVRRGLLLFDLSTVPREAVIESVSLQLTLAKAPGGDTERVIALHRALASWGENAASDAGSGGGSGSGVPAMFRDATWLARFFDEGPAWTKAGGEFAVEASATTAVSTVLTKFTWSGAGLLRDVQAWVAKPAGNFGWFVLGEEGASRTNRQFFTHESTAPETAPVLKVRYSLPKKDR